MQEQSRDEQLHFFHSAHVSESCVLRLHIGPRLIGISSCAGCYCRSRARFVPVK